MSTRRARCYFLPDLDVAALGAHFACSAGFLKQSLSRRAWKSEMRQVRSLLRTASSRIGRRLAQIVAIAAASLPVAGA
ncbi:hypothetical protein [Bradyrhizobium sp.]|uniref:hypothetical protein n=1 Tax=Bradyrhizobium sp. TaxID=376 RepID=UPI0025C6C3ED|nr:hypothetical protein [Bradyrhizobium sp.]